MMKTRYIHIGYPKAASTTLQNDFFANHPQLHHLGFKHKNSRGQYQHYIDDDINAALEIDLRCKKDLLFDYEKTKKNFHNHFINAENMHDKKAVGISFEGLCYTNINDIDITQKAERLKYIFGENTKIIIVIREQRNAIKSFYSNSVQTGYFHSYQKYIEHLLLFQFRTFISDFKYYDVYKLYSRLFGKANVLVLPLERLKSHPDQFQKNLCDFLNVDNHNFKFSSKNLSHNRSSIQYNRLFNYLFRHNLGKTTMSDVFSFRYETYFKNESIAYDADLVQSHKLRMKNNINLSRLLSKLPFSPKCNFDVIENYANDFRKLFSLQNQRLSAEAGLDLASLGYMVD